MTIAGIAYVIGILVFQLLPAVPAMTWMVVPGIAALVGLVKRRAVPLAFVALGFAWAWWHAAVQITGQLSPVLEGEDLTIEGVVASLPVVSDRLTRFELLTDRALDPPGAEIPARLRLSWYEQAPALIPGDRWRLTVRLKRPNGSLNPGAFDYERYLFARRIGATGYVREDPANQRLGTDRYRGRIDRWRWGLRERILRTVDLDGVQGLTLALTLGDRSLVEAGQRHTLLRTGTAHLLAISGLHIGLLAGMAYGLTRRFWSRSQRLAWHLPAPIAAGLIALVAAGAYAMLAGLSLPTQRALVMLAVVIVAGQLRRPLRPLYALLLALVIVLTLDPLAVITGSFWLSFTAVAVIAWLILGRARTGPRWRSLLRVQLALAVGLAPLSLTLFQQVSLAGLLANLIAIPLVGFIVVPLNLAAAALVALAPSLAVPLLLAAGWVLTGLMALLESMSQWPAAVLTQGAPSGWGLGLAVAGAVIVLAPRGWPHRWLGVLLLLPLALQPRGGPACGEAWVWALDVGMGAATLVETCRHALVFDTGPRWSERFDAGSAIVLPFLRERGIGEIDRLIVSHGDRDHSGGTQALLDAFPGTPLSSGTPEQFSGHAVSGCRAGRSWRWDGVDFELLHPLDEGGNDNDRSCVLRIAARGGSALLTGDIEARSERALLRRSPGALDVDVLIAPHHGSSSSSTPEFVNAVDADLVLFSVGYLNRWRLPHPGVLERYEGGGALILRTDHEGAVQIGLGPEGMEAPWRARREMRAYWRRPLREH